MSDFGNPIPPPPPPSSTPPPPGGAYGPPQPTGPGPFASWPTRVGGYVLDYLLLLPGLVLIFVGMPKTYNASTTVNGETRTTTGGDDGNIALLLVGIALYLAVLVWNRWYKGGSTGQTIGRGVVGVKLVDEATGQPIGFGKAFVRDLAHILDSIVCGIPLGWAWPLWDPQRQTWADKICKTVVVTVPKA